MAQKRIWNNRADIWMEGGLPSIFHILFSIFLFYTKNPLPKTEKLLILGNECVIIDLRGDFL